MVSKNRDDLINMKEIQSLTRRSKTSATCYAVVGQSRRSNISKRLLDRKLKEELKKCNPEGLPYEESSIGILVGQAFLPDLM